MKKITLITLFLSISFVCFAQDSSTKRTEKFKPDIIPYNSEESRFERLRAEGRKDSFQKIQKGKTTEKEILDWFGEPEQVIEGDNTLSEQWLLVHWFPKNHPLPKINQKVLQYKYAYTYYYRGPLNARGVDITILITINKKSGIVEECSYSESEWIS